MTESVDMSARTPVDQVYGQLLRRAASAGLKTAALEHLQREAERGRSAIEAVREVESFERLLVDVRRQEPGVGGYLVPRKTLRVARILSVCCGAFVVGDLAWSGITLPLALLLGITTTALALGAVRTLFGR